MEFGLIGQLELEKFGKGTQVNIGDATMLATLQALGKNRPTIMIDQNTEVAQKILESLSAGTPPFEFLRQKNTIFNMRRFPNASYQTRMPRQEWNGLTKWLGRMQKYIWIT